MHGLVNILQHFPFIQAPSGDVYAKPMKKKPTPDSEYPANGVQNDTYANMQGWKKDFSCEIFKERFFLCADEAKL